nr:unnamed protein product [Callosobruchus chinensis]
MESPEGDTPDAYKGIKLNPEEGGDETKEASKKVEVKKPLPQKRPPWGGCPTAPPLKPSLQLGWQSMDF